MISTRTTAKAEATLIKNGTGQIGGPPPQGPITLGDLRELIRTTYSMPDSAAVYVNNETCHKMRIVDEMYVAPFLTTVTGGDPQ